MPAGCSVDELRGDPHALAGAADRAFEHRAHAEFAADGANVDRASLIGEARVARDHRQAGDLRQIGDDVFADAVGEILLLRIARHVGERQNGDRCSRDRSAPDLAALDRAWRAVVAPGCHFQTRIGRSIFLTADFAAILEANVDPIADAFVDDRGDADPAGLGERFQAGGDIDAIAVNVVAFDDDVAEIDADPQHDGRLRGALIRRVALERCTDSAQFTASTTLPNSTMVPSPISFTMRPLWAATAGSKTVSRCRFRAASVPASSAPIRRE